MIVAPLAAGLLAALYLRAALAGAWPRWRTACFIGGTAALALAPVVGGSLAAHMAEHSLLTAIAAPLLVLGAPLALASRRLSQRGRERLLGALRWPPLRVLGAPLVAWWAFVLAQWAAHVPGVIAATEARPALHVAEHGLLLAIAIAFWLPAIGVGPRPMQMGRRLDPTGRALYLFAAVPALDLAALMLMVTGEPAAGAAMLGGTIPLALGAVWASWRWIAREERVARAVAADGHGGGRDGGTGRAEAFHGVG